MAMPTNKVITQLAAHLTTQSKMLCTAESCTGGLIAKMLTDTAGSSDWFDRGFISYSNQAKMDMLGVQGATLQQHGAVSEAVVQEMAQGAIKNSGAQFSIAVTGIAGPGGATPDKPVGTVWFGFAHEQKVFMHHMVFAGDREQVREQSARYALQTLWKYLMLD